MGAGKSGKGQFACVRLAFMHVHFGAFFVNLFNFQNIGKVKLRVNALRKHVQRHGNKVKVTGAFAVAEQRTFNAFRACHHGKLCRCYCRAAVVMRVDTDNRRLAVIQIFAEVFNLVGIGVGRAHFHRGGQV